MKQGYPPTQQRPRRKQRLFGQPPVSETLYKRLNEPSDDALDETFPRAMPST
jgi:hypothetical protein